MNEKARRFLVLLVLCFCEYLQSTFANQPMWVSDQLQTAITDLPKIDSKYMGALKAGSKVSFLRSSEDGRYALIRSGDVEGWIYTRNLSSTPSIQQRFSEQSKMLAELQTQYAELTKEHSLSDTVVADLQKKLQQAKVDSETYRTEFTALKRASANVVEIDKRNQELHAQTVALEQENLRLHHQITRLEEVRNHRQMLIGGGLVFAGMLMALLISALRGLRRHRRMHDL